MFQRSYLYVSMLHFKKWLEWQGDSGTVGELRFQQLGDRRWHAAGIRLNKSIGMKKKQKKQKKQ